MELGKGTGTPGPATFLKQVGETQLPRVNHRYYTIRMIFLFLIFTQRANR
ncbi:hypothetical protein GC56T2_0921 [Geobacillus sp. C56-T2]|nr:hypothetical protein GC56T2_0921 [Geobacillus sp. C56-T2]